MPENLSIEDLLGLLERFLKSGRLSFSLLTWNRRDEAVINELVIKYQDNLALVYIRNPDGQIVPVGTETDLLFQEFLAKFLEVSVTKQKPDYDPQMWFMLRENSVNFTGYDAEVISQFYQFVENNLSSLKPYLLQVKDSGKLSKLVPFISATTVFYDMNKVMSNGSILNMDDALKAIVTLMNNVKTDLTNLLDSTKNQYNEALNALETNITRHQTEINTLKTDINTVVSKYNTTLSTLNTLAANVDYKIRGLQFSVAGDSNTAYPIRLQYTSGDGALTGGNELFLASPMITYSDNNRNVVIMLGLGNDSIGSFHTGGTKFTISQNCTGAGTPCFSNAYLIGAGTYIVMLGGARTYTVWSKHIDKLTVEAGAYAKNGYNPTAFSTVLNRMVAARYNSTYVGTFTDTVYLYGELVLQNRYRIRVVR